MKKLLIVSAFLSALSCGAQEIRFDSTQAIPDGMIHPVNDTIFIDKVTVESLTARMKEDRIGQPKLRLQVIVSSSYGCGGNGHAMDYVNRIYRRYKDSVRVYYILGDVEKDRKEYRRAARYLAPSVRLFSAAERYRDPEDARVGPDTLTKQLFPQSANDVIGTPKYLIYDVKEKKLVFHGFKHYDNPLPEDIVAYFMEKRKKR